MSDFINENGEFSADWLEQAGVSEDLRGDRNLTEVRTVRDLAEQFANAQKLIGKKTINAIPGEDATDEERAKFFQALGVPDDPDGYELNLENMPEGTAPDEELTAQFKQAAKEANLTKAQAQGLLDWFNTQSGQRLEQMQSQMTEQFQTAEAELKKEWGKQFDKNLEIANRMVDKYELGDILKQKGLDNDPNLANFLYKVGKEMGEDSNIQTPRSGGTVGADAAQSKINSIFADKAHPYWDGKSPKHAEAVVEVQNLMHVVHGDEPANEPGE